MASPSTDYVILPGGLTVAREVLHLAFDLESRGVRLTVSDGTTLTVSPRHLITAQDIEQITRWKLHLCAFAVYRAPVPAWLQ